MEILSGHLEKALTFPASVFTLTLLYAQLNNLLVAYSSNLADIYGAIPSPKPSCWHLSSEILNILDLKLQQLLSVNHPWVCISFITLTETSGFLICNMMIS